MKRRSVIQALVLAPLALLLPKMAVAAAEKAAAAATLPHLDPNEPIAKAMQYSEDASKASAARTDKKAFCNNCAKFNKCAPGDAACKPLKDAKAAYQPCEVFTGKMVNANGWCMSWTKKG